jgi:hypothetical protein
MSNEPGCDCNGCAERIAEVERERDAALEAIRRSNEEPAAVKIAEWHKLVADAVNERDRLTRALAAARERIALLEQERRESDAAWKLIADAKHRQLTTARGLFESCLVSVAKTLRINRGQSAETMADGVDAVVQVFRARLSSLGDAQAFAGVAQDATGNLPGKLPAGQRGHQSAALPGGDGGLNPPPCSIRSGLGDTPGGEPPGACACVSCIPKCTRTKASLDNELCAPCANDHPEWAIGSGTAAPPESAPGVQECQAWCGGVDGPIFGIIWHDHYRQYCSAACRDARRTLHPCKPTTTTRKDTDHE